jgi:hypothetical protein
MSSLDRDVKPDIDLPNETSPNKRYTGEYLVQYTHGLCLLADPTRLRSGRPTATAKTSPSKAGSRSVKTEITGTDDSGFKPTSKGMAYHYVMHVLDKVTIETRKEIAQKLGVKQKNLDAVGSRIKRTARSDPSALN